MPPVRGRQQTSNPGMYKLAAAATLALTLLVCLSSRGFPPQQQGGGNAAIAAESFRLHLRIESLQEDEAAATAAPATPQTSLPRPHGLPLPPPPPLPSCHHEPPSVDAPEVWPMSCQLLSEACVDQQAIILYDQKYQADGRRAPEPLPLLQPLGKQANTYIWRYRSGVARGRVHIPPIDVRPASQFEAPAYLSQPVFSNCTVPVIYFPFWAENPAHVLRDNGARLYMMLKSAPWRRHAKLVVHTPDGLQLPRFAREVFQSLSGLSMQTWADFSSRLHPGPSAADGPSEQQRQQQQPLQEAWPGGPRLPPSFEGGDQRCFRRLYVCTNVTGSRYLPPFSFGQHVVRAYKHLLPAEAAAAEPAEAAVAVAGVGRGAAAGCSSGGGSSSGWAAGVPSAPEPAAAAAAAAAEDGFADAAWDAAPAAALEAAAALQAVAGDGGGDGERLLRIVFQRRAGGHPGRQLLNVTQLLQHCNGWRFTPPSGKTVRAVCHEAEFPDLQTGLREAQAADVMVGMHGANLANGFLMRPGGAVVEIHAPGMQAVAEHMQFAERNVLDVNTQVQWWVLMVCDSRTWVRDAIEDQQQGNYAAWVRARSVAVRWDALEAVLRAAVKTRGDMGQYRRRYAEGRYYWHMLSKGRTALSPGKHAKCPSGLNVTAPPAPPLPPLRPPPQPAAL